MTFQVEYTIHARNELTDTYLWIKEQAPRAAEKWRDDLIHKVDELADQPFRHPIASESHKFPCEIRLLLFRKRRGQFRIYYTVHQDRVVILSVRRSSKKPLDAGDLPL